MVRQQAGEKYSHLSAGTTKLRCLWKTSKQQNVMSHAWAPTQDKQSRARADRRRRGGQVGSGRKQVSPQTIKSP